MKGQYNNELTGSNGRHTITDTAANTMPSGKICFAIVFIEDTVINSITFDGDYSDTGDGMTGITFPAMSVEYVRASAITLTSGKCTCYLTDS